MASYKKDYRDLITHNAHLVNLIIFGFGLILVIISIIVKTENVCGQILLSVGTSLVASTIVVYISSKYILQQSRIKKVIEEWGLTGIFETRQRMNEFSNINLEKNESSMDMMAFGLKSYRHAKGALLKEKVNKGMKVRIITIDPNSKFLKEREKNEDCLEGEIRNTIIQLIEWINDINQYAGEDNKAEIKIYDSLPLDFYCRMDKALYVGPYLHGIDSQQTISYEYRYSSRGYDYYSAYFEKIIYKRN